MSQTLPPQPLSTRELFAPHRLARLIVVGILAIAALLLVGWEIWRVTASPTLTVDSPADNLLTQSHNVELKGHTEAGTSLTVNGSVLPVSMEGNFSENIDLRTGANIITITASKKFAKPKIIYRKVVVTQ